MTEGDTETLTATVTPSNATDKSVTWTSSNTSVATVSADGVVTAKTSGTATITVMTTDGRKTATCAVTVKAKVINVTGVSLDQTSLTLKEGDTRTLTATVTPSDATDKSVTWSTSNSSVATVSASGVVTAKSSGTATITVTTTDGSKKATCSVSVKPKVTGVSLDNTAISLLVGQTQWLTATVTPADALDKSVTWSSNNTSVATVSSSGLVTAKAIGSATITVRTTDGDKTATCLVTVTPVSVTSVSLNKTSLIMYENDSETLIATVLPSNASNKAAFWSSSNTSVASVSSTGKVSALSTGSAIITVTTEDGNKTASCSVTVKADPYGAVDLGLSVKWAPYNYGASYENEVGGYYKWGDPTGTAAGYSFSPPEVDTISGTQYDVVRAHWGGDWRIPTAEEIRELKNQCTKTWTNVGGVYGVRFTGRNGNSIFLPASGIGYSSKQWATSETTSYSYEGQASLMAGTSYYNSTFGARVIDIYLFSEESFNTYIIQRLVNNVSIPIRPVR